MSDIALPKISVRGLRKSFGRNRVLDNLDIDCATGESLVIIGGSGTGKSVLVKCILGLLRPEAGSIRIDGVETTRLRRAARVVLRNGRDRHGCTHTLLIVTARGLTACTST